MFTYSLFPQYCLKFYILLSSLLKRKKDKTCSAGSICWVISIPGDQIMLEEQVRFPYNVRHVRVVQTQMLLCILYNYNKLSICTTWCWPLLRSKHVVAIFRRWCYKYILLYGSETWTIKARDTRRITAAEMKYMRITAGYTWTDYKTNGQIAKELKITPILDKLLEYKRSWIQYVNRMPRNRLPRVMKHYCPTGRRNRGRLLKRLLDMWDRNGSTGGPAPWQIYDDYDDDDGICELCFDYPYVPYIVL